MKSLFVSTFAIFLSFATFGQSLLRNSSDVDNAIPDTSIKKIKPQKFGRAVKVRYKDGNLERIKMDSLWGYTNKKGKVFRIYKHHIYQILKEEEFITYFVTSFIAETGPRTYWFFSKDRDSEIVNRKKKLDKI